MKVTLTMMQRLALETLVAAQRGTMADLFVLYDIREKVKVPPEQREEYVKVLPNGTVLADQKAIEAAPTLDVEFEKEEARRVARLLQTWDRFTPEDFVWLLPLKKAFDENAVT
jgi:hypothetical protein